MILFISFTALIIVFTCALVWKSIRAWRYTRNAADTEERPTAAMSAEAPLLTALSAESRRSPTPPPSYEDVVEEDRRKTEHHADMK